MIIETEMTIKTLKDLVRSGTKHFNKVEVTEYGDIHYFNFDEVIFEECKNAQIDGIVFLKNTQYSSENTIEDLKEMVK